MLHAFLPYTPDLPVATGARVEASTAADLVPVPATASILRRVSRKGSAGLALLMVFLAGVGLFVLNRLRI